MSYEELNRWTRQERSDSLWPVIEPIVQGMMSSTRQEEWLSGFQLLVTASRDDLLGEWLRAAFQRALEGLPGAALWAIEVAPRYHHRLATIRSLFAAAETPELLARPAEAFAGFPSAKGLIPQTVVGHELFFQPALISTAPFVLGAMGSRAGGIVVLLFGEALAGVEERTALELLQLYRPRSPVPDLPGQAHRPAIGLDVAERLLGWWTEKTDELLGLTLDPANFQDADGNYDPREQFGMVLSLQSLFASVQGVLAYTMRDDFVRKLLFFDALDLLEGIGIGTYERTANPRRATQLLGRLKEQLPEPVRQVVLPKCESAVEALTRVGEGFFLPERRTAAGNILMRRSDGAVEEKAEAVAIPEYLRLVRNTTHSFREIVTDRRRVGLLASHTGDLPRALADLPLMYVVALLHDPQSTLGWRRP